MKTYLILGLIAATIAAVAFGGRIFDEGVAVEAAKAHTATIRELIDERGKTRLPRVYNITMPFAGRIEAIGFVEGTPVERDQVVAQIVPADLKLAMDAATAAVERLDAAIQENDDASVENVALKQSYKFVESMERSVEAAEERVRAGKAKLDYAQRNRDRIFNLFRDKKLAASEQEFEAAQLALVEADVAYQQDQLVQRAMEAMQAATNLMPVTLLEYIGRKKLSHEVLERQKEEARVRWQENKRDQNRGRMTSPVDGVVLARMMTDERMVTAGTVLLKIGDLRELEVEVDVLSQEVVKIKLGQPAEIMGPAIGDRPLHGTVKNIYPAGFTKVSSLGVEQQRVKVILAFNDEDQRQLIERRAKGEWDLGVDYRVRVRIITAERSGALVIPRSALFRGADGRWQVFVIRDGYVELQPIEVGLMNDEQVEVQSGVAADELLVLAPETNLTDGTKVNPIERAARVDDFSAAGD
ncbi:MAG: efflux RND transporter periplasmic adaptor subunit [Pirellulales bacterium]